MTTSIPTAYIDSWLSFRQRYLRIPGVQAAILSGDEIVFSSAYGLADVESGTPMTEQHLFRIASHSKTFTATAIMQLVEAGKVRLDDPLSAHLDWIGAASPKIAALTLRELLGHASGIFRDSNDSDFWQLMRPFPDEHELKALITDESGILPPNERFKYSNIGYSLLGMVIAAVSGVSYNEYVTSNIVDRLELRDTAPELDSGRAGDYATGYTAFSYHDERIPIDHVDTRAMSAATGFSSTATDVCRYAAGHFFGDSRLINDASKRQMQHEEWADGGGDKGYYGLGMSIDEVEDRRLIGHGGGYPGMITRTVFDPKEKLAVSVLTNAIDGAAEELAYGIIRLIGLAAEKVDEPVDADADRFCGRFACLWGVMDVVRLGGQLRVVRPTVGDPTSMPVKFEVAGKNQLRVTESPGGGAPGELVTYEFDGDTVRSITGPGGMTSYPEPEFRRRIGERTRIARP